MIAALNAVDPSPFPTWALIAIIPLAAVQLTLMITALVILARTPHERVVLGRKWVWALIIVFVNLIGAIVFFAAGRTPARAPEPNLATPEPGAENPAARTIRSLYGDELAEPGDR